MKAEIEKLATDLMDAGPKSGPDPKGAAVVFIVVTGGLLIVLPLVFGGFGIGTLSTALFVGLFALVLNVSSSAGPYRQRAATLLLEEQALRHRPALRRNLGRAVKRNDYGAVIADTRVVVVEEFARSIGFPKSILSPEQMLTAIVRSLGNAATTDASRGGDLDMVPADPILFEQWVADKLRIKGWEVAVTAASGDQGIDVIARKNGVSVGIQCKLYTGAVGNTAVQQVIAGVQYHGLTKGAVLTNANYTQSAVNLARSADILLMSHYDLSDPDRKLL